MTPILLFEDAAAPGLGPLVHTRPSHELRVGALNLRERLQLLAPERRLHARLRGPLQAVAREAGCGVETFVPDEGPLLLLNAAWDGTVGELEALLAPPWSEGLALVDDGRLALAHVPAGAVESTLAEPPSGEPLESGALLRHPWHAVQRNPERLVADAEALAGRALARRIFGAVFAPDAPLLGHLTSSALEPLTAPTTVQVAGAHPILAGPGLDLRPGVVLDATDGPILLGAGCRLGANVVVEGPAYLGPGCTVNPGAKLREGTSLGAGCKFGGEVEESIVLDLSNKQHDGFLGHAYLGSWVNLGADTNASDLKNNYGTVRVDLGDGRIDSGERFVGPTIGDHAKTGINTMLSTGAVLGVCANVFGGGFPPATLPAFTWGGAEALAPYDLDRALETAEVVLGRRGVVFTKAQAALLRDIHRRTQPHRDAVLGG